MADHQKLAEKHAGEIRALFARADHNTVDEVMAALDLPREVVNLAAPWAYAELDDKNSDIYDVQLTGAETDWVARPGVNLDNDGVPQPFRAPALAVVTLRARSSAEAKQAAAVTHPGFDKVESVKKRSAGS